MNRIVLFMLFILVTSVTATVTGDRIASYPLPGGYNIEQQITGLAISRGRIYIANSLTNYIYRGNAYTGAWEKSWFLTQDSYPYGMSASNSTDTLALVGNAGKRLFFLDISGDNLDILGSVLLDESVVQETNPPYLTGVQYIMYNGNYRVMVVDRDNFKLYEVDPILMQYKGKFNAPSEISKTYWMRCLSYDFEIGCILWSITCFDEALIRIDSSMIAAYDPNTWTRRTDLYRNGHFCPTCAYDTQGQGRWYNGYETYVNIRGIGYLNDYPGNKKVYLGAGMETQGYSPQAVWMYASFYYDGTNLKTTTWGGIKKMYASSVSCIRKPSSGSAKTASRDISANRNTLRRIFIPKRATVK
ncbi:MAG: hypothetical protein JXA60_09295 [Candidatus Coatesbacteria bacterium]|nr:hypothetical protein [Candidatus Coatesbacteria bacterium]